MARSETCAALVRLSGPECEALPNTRARNDYIGQSLNSCLQEIELKSRASAKTSTHKQINESHSNTGGVRHLYTLSTLIKGPSTVLTILMASLWT